MSTANVFQALRLHADDNVAVATCHVEIGGEIVVGNATVSARQSIPPGHKVALVAIDEGDAVRRYGETIGYATESIEPGDWVHVHNMTAGTIERDYVYADLVGPDPDPIAGQTFLGYRRADGRAATRNYIAVVSSVNCSASVSKYISRRFDESLLRDFPHIDGVLPLTHKGGCAMEFDGAEHRQLNRVLAGFARHPNIGGYLLVGLGCETGTIGHLVDSHGLVQIGQSPADTPEILSIQQTGGTRRTVEEGVRRLAEMLPRVNDVRRVPIEAAELIVGTECGGSDGNSGVTANPALGVASDNVVACGGTVVLSEVPEIYGAEHLLARRARTPQIGRKLIERIRWWEDYATKFNVKLDNNPSPGNKAGGLTTIYEKSLGAIAKGGSTALAEVYQYAERVRARGLVVMDSPGYDPMSVTGMVAGGANMICFTTGRGSCFGCKPVPSIKIATNTPMYRRMEDDMDVDAGVILSGTPLEEVGRQIFELILAVASGQKTKSELHGVGEEEFAPWSIGPIL